MVEQRKLDKRRIRRDIRRSTKMNKMLETMTEVEELTVERRPEIVKRAPRPLRHSRRRGPKKDANPKWEPGWVRVVGMNAWYL